MERQGRRDQGGVQLLCEACLCRAENSRRNRRGPPDQAGGFLFRQGHHHQEDAGGGTLYQRIREVVSGRWAGTQDCSACDAGSIWFGAFSVLMAPRLCPCIGKPILWALGGARRV